MEKIFFVFLMTVCLVMTSAQECDEVDCTGKCGSYIDEDSNTFCDYSILSNNQSKKSYTELTTEKSTEKVIKENALEVEKKLKSEPEEINKKIENTSEIVSKNQSEKPYVYRKKSQRKHKAEYDLLTLLALCSGLYFITHTLAGRNIIKKSTHKKIWNSALLLTFLISCLFGLALVVELNYDIWKSSFKTLLYWHVEIGICMTIISVFHILWHWKYFKNLIKNS